MKNICCCCFIAMLMMLGAGSSMAQAKKPVLNHIARYVVDLKKSTTFYTQVIGLDTMPEPFHDGKHTWLVVGDYSHLHLISGSTAGGVQDHNNHLCFSVPSVEDIIAKLNKFNVEYYNWAGDKKSITTRVDGVKQIYFQDPDGYWVEINNDYPTK